MELNENHDLMLKKIMCIEDLPLELLRSIMEYLTLNELGRMNLAFMTSVLQSLFRAAIDGMEIHQLMNYRVNPIEIQWLSRMNVSATVVNFLGYDASNCLRFIDKNRSRLIVMNFSDCDLTDEQLNEIGMCPSLTDISFQGCESLTDESVTQFLRTHPLVKTLNLGNTSLSGDVLAYIANYCPNIENLSLGDNSWVDDESLTILTESPILNLRTIDISLTSVADDESIYHLAARYPNIEEISCFRCDLSVECHRYRLTEISFKSLMNQNLTTQYHGVQSFYECGGLGIVVFCIFFNCS